MSDLLAKVPPHSSEAERSVLGGVLLGGEGMTLEVFDVASDALSSSDFYLSKHRVTWDAMSELRKREEQIDVQTLVMELERRQQLDQAGGVSYLVSLTHALPTSANVPFYAQEVARCATRRRAITHSHSLMQLAWEPGTSLEELQARAESIPAELFGQLAVCNTALSAGGWAGEVGSHIAEVRDRKTPPGIMTKIASLDAITGGMRPGEATVIAARPSVGKTALATNICRELGDSRVPFVFASAETTTRRLGVNLACSMTPYMGEPVKAERARDGGFTDAEAASLERARAEMARWSCLVDYQPWPSPVSRVEALVKRGVAQLGAKVAVVDYLQKLSGSGSHSSRYEEVSEVSQRLVHLSRRLGIHMILLCQLNRESDKRTGGAPRKSDLKESGQIEQDADVIVLLHRPGFHELESGDKAEHEVDLSEAWAVVSKNRNGRVGKARLRFHPDYLLFTSE